MALAKFLIGKTLVHDTPRGRLAGRIVETEAYPPGDASGHAYRGQTRANRSLFLERGRSYVFFSYGWWYMMNVSSERASVGAGVLLRALEPLEGIPQMQRARGTRRLHDLARGPGCLAQAMRITRRFDGLDLCAPGPLWLGAAVRPTGKIAAATRIGISRARHHLRRFFERGNPCVSGSKRLSR